MTPTQSPTDAELIAEARVRYDKPYAWQEEAVKDWPDFAISLALAGRLEARAASPSSPPSSDWVLVLKDALMNLDELVASVRGECSSLLDEDSGGSARLSMDIDDVLAKGKALLASPPSPPPLCPGCASIAATASKLARRMGAEFEVNPPPSVGTVTREKVREILLRLVSQASNGPYMPAVKSAEASLLALLNPNPQPPKVTE